MFAPEPARRHAGDDGAVIDATLAPGSSYDLPDPPHARPEQLRKAYPRRDAVLTAKRRSDPQLRFKNALWDRYMA